MLFSPFPTLVSQRLFGRKSLEAVAVEVIEECPAESGPTKPVLILDRERGLVTRSQEETTLENEWRRLDGGEAQHRATLRYVFEEVTATPYGFFTKGQAFSRFGKLRADDLLTSGVRRLEAGFYASNQICMKYFGHWLCDGFVVAGLRQADEILVKPYVESWGHAPRYIDRLFPDAIANEIVHFDRMSFSDDIGQTSNRGQRLRDLRERVRALAETSGAPGVYLRRGDGGAKRSLVNEDEVLGVMKDIGFSIVSATDDLDSIWAASGGAPITVTLEGSHFNHVFLSSREDAFHIVINPSDRFNLVFADFVTHTGGRLATTVATRDGDGYRANVDSILELIAMAQGA